MMMSKEVSLMGSNKDRHGILQQSLERAEKLCAQSPINYAVITRNSHAEHRYERYVTAVSVSTG